ncbi:MAG: hypothetical protein AB1589_05755 [Cyanobacteriota bacterium]
MRSVDCLQTATWRVILDVARRRSLQLFLSNRLNMSNYINAPCSYNLL